MSLLGSLARAWLVDRLVRGRRRGRHPVRHGPYGRRRGRVGFFGPVPYYSRRTRSGARVSVGGCCLPVPLMVLGSTGLAGAAAARRLTRGRGAA